MCDWFVDQSSDSFICVPDLAGPICSAIIRSVDRRCTDDSRAFLAGHRAFFAGLQVFLAGSHTFLTGSHVFVFIASENIVSIIDGFINFIRVFTS